MTALKNARTAPYIIPPGTKLRCLRDDIIVKALEWSPSTSILIAGNKRQTLRGVVTQVGPGCYPTEYRSSIDGRWSTNVPKGYRTESREGRRFRATQVKAGDTVELGGLELDGYKFQELMIDNELHVKCREADVVYIDERQTE